MYVPFERYGYAMKLSFQCFTLLSAVLCLLTRTPIELLVPAYADPCCSQWWARHVDKAHRLLLQLQAM